MPREWRHIKKKIKKLEFFINIKKYYLEFHKHQKKKFRFQSLYS